MLAFLSMCKHASATDMSLNDDLVTCLALLDLATTT